MREVLISIQPKWCELIANGTKTVEVRKTRPKIETPFKVYVYCTKERMPIKENGSILMYEDDLALTNRYGQGKRVENPNGAMLNGEVFLNSKVIGEFVCDRIDTIRKRGIDDNFDYCYLSLDEWGNDDIEPEITAVKNSCVLRDDLNDYGENSRMLYGWHISDLVIYDKPKELEAFTTFCDANKKHCANCKHYLFDNDDLNGYRRWCDVCHRKPLTRPPQSWCYIKEV